MGRRRRPPFCQRLHKLDRSTLSPSARLDTGNSITRTAVPTPISDLISTGTAAPLDKLLDLAETETRNLAQLTSS